MVHYKTHCKRGHEFTPDNIYVQANGGRVCKVCQRAANRKWLEANRDRYALLQKQWHSAHPDYQREQSLRFRDNHPHYHRDYQRRKLAADPNHREYLRAKVRKHQDKTMHPCMFCPTRVHEASTLCQECGSFVQNLLGLNRWPDMETLLAHKDQILKLTTNPETRRSYQWLKRTKKKLKKARQLLDQPKQAA